MSRRLYLLRHGLTVANEQNIVQGLNDPLHPKGIEQAKILAERMTHISFDTLVSSDLPRAKDTAEYIAEKTGHAICHTELLREIGYPTALQGLSRTSAEVQEYFAQKNAHMEDVHFRFEDEETVAEIHLRSRKALEYIASQPGDVVAVTHGNSMRRIVCEILFGNSISEEAEVSAMRRMVITNTGITVLEEHEGNWLLATWNDHAHLG